MTQEGISTEPSKVEAVISWPTPMNKRDLRGFLGLCSYYRKFIKSYSDVADQLYKLIERKLCLLGLNNVKKHLMN